MVAIHIVLIIAIPLPLVLYNIYVLVAYTLFPTSIVSKTLSMLDLIYPSTYDMWYNTLDPKLTLYITLSLAVFFYLIALIELASYYSTDLLNTGRYKTVKTIGKRFLLYFFWTLIQIYISIYVALFVQAAIWLILGAILNPAAFLPGASGSATLLTFVKTQKSKYKKLYEDLQGTVSELVDGKLKGMMSNTM